MLMKLKDNHYVISQQIDTQNHLSYNLIRDFLDSSLDIKINKFEIHLLA